MTTLPLDGREYITWPVENIPEGTAVEVELRNVDAVAWHPTERVSATEVRALLAGPDVDQGGAVASLPRGRTFARLRFTAGAEVVIRRAGTIDVR